MITKFETKSQRVKGLSFHPTKPWLLTSLHSGSVQLWDYRISVMVDKFEEHEGPVRGVCFHDNQPIFVTGGDDFKIKGWNYKTRKCIFTITGHLDYIRTVQYHHELPWVLSTSDDQTLRIWNWQSRQLVSLLTGHNHYVMCGKFHPKDDLILSCSLDQTIRLWDFSKLKKKHTGGTGKTDYISAEVELIASLEAHERGVNWVAFHPTQNMFVSAADDRKIRLWKYSETKAWEHDTLYGHSNNISCVLFAPNLDVIVSNSEDKTIRVWDLHRRSLIDTFRKETERYWMLAVHPTENLIASGSDNGISVFTFERERIPSYTHNELVFYAKKTALHAFDLNTKRDYLIKEFEHVSSSLQLIYQKPRRIAYNIFNPSKHVIMVLFDDKNKIFYKNYFIEFDLKFRENPQNIKAEIKYYYSLPVAFIGKTRFMAFSEANGLEIVDLSNMQVVTSSPSPIEGTIEFFNTATLGKTLVKTSEGTYLYDTTAKKVIGNVEGTELGTWQRSEWNATRSLCAMICKKSLVIVTKNLQKIATINEKFSVNSAIWTQDNVLLYTTLNHVKYGLINGETGIISCLSSKRYLVRYIKEKKELYYLTSMGEVCTEILKTDDFTVKMALLQSEPNKIKSLLKGLSIQGNSFISYLYRQKYPGLALGMVDNPQAKFALALDSGNLDIAYKTALELNNIKTYSKLAEEALRQGNQQIVEVCYQKIRDYEKLSFLYLVTGNHAKLQKMQVIAQNRKDVMSRFQNALLLGDVAERVKVLTEAGQLPLAYICAVTHNLREEAANLKQLLGDNLPDIPRNSEALFPPRPVFNDQANSKFAQSLWPHETLAEEEIYIPIDLGAGAEELLEGKGEEISNAFGTDEIIPPPCPEIITAEPKQESPVAVVDHKADKAWEIEDDLDLGEENITQNDKPEAVSAGAAIQTHFHQVQHPVEQYVKNISQLAGEHVAIGSFDSALNLLKKQVGLKNSGPLKQIMSEIYSSSLVFVPSIPFGRPIRLRLGSPESEGRPILSVTPQKLVADLQQAYQAFTDAKINDASEIFTKILLKIPLLVLRSSAMEKEIRELQKICLNYLLVLNLDAAKKKAKEGSDEFLDLSLRVACCNLQPAHRCLMLRAALASMHKSGNHIFTVFLARRILQLVDENPQAMASDKVSQIKRVLAAAESKGANASSLVFSEKDLYDPNFVNRVDSESLKALGQGEPASCPYCSACYSEEKKGSGATCSVCKVGEIGALVIGLKLY